LCAAILAAGAFFAAPAKTRWSAIQFIPSADVLSGGRFVADADLFWGLDTFSISSPVSVQMLHIGLSEWVNMDIGYADGFTMGFKVRLITEVDTSLIPTLTIGAQNLYTNREALYFGHEHGDYPANEIYLAAAKSSEWAKLRVHLGVLSALPYKDSKDRFNPFIGIEKYFGQKLYMTTELQRRNKDDYILSVFGVYRFLTDMLELNVGVVDVLGLGMLKNNSSDDRTIIRPGLRVGLKAYIGSGYNTFEGLTGVEDRIDRHRDTISEYGRRLDSLEAEVRWSAQRIHALSGFSEERKEERARVMDELIMLRNLYEQESYDPELVRNTIENITDRRKMFLPHLRVIITDPEVPLRIRTLAVSLIGEMKDKAAANILISILGRLEEPPLKIETMIALGKMKDTRCGPVLKTLQGDPDGGIAFTAAEVYRTLFGGEQPEPKPSTTEDPVSETVPERRIGR
jgi:hypothetical protein